MTQQHNDFPAGLSAPACRALDGAGYVRLEQLTRVSEAGEDYSSHAAEPHIRIA